MKKYISLFLIAIISLLSLTGCSYKKFFHRNEASTESGYYFDTIITITLYGDDKKYIKPCFEMCEDFDKAFSASKEDSPIYEINNHPGEFVTVNDDVLSLIKTSLSYCEKYPDRFDITCGNLCDIWSVKDSKVPPSEADISKALSGIDYNNIVIDGNNVMLKSTDCKIDLGAAAKGYIADALAKYLRDKGVKYGLINLGGNVLTLDAKSKDGYRIGIQEPFSEDGNVICSLSLSNMSVVTSGRYQRYFEYNDRIYHHIFDLSTGYPVEGDLNSVTIITESSTDADILSTIAFTYGLDEGMKLIESLDNVEAIFIDTDNKVHTTSGIEKYSFQQ